MCSTLLGCGPGGDGKPSPGESGPRQDDSRSGDETGSRPESGEPGDSHDTGQGAGDPDHDADGCEPIYFQDRLPAFELTIADADWAALQADYAGGVKQYHPAVFTFTDDDGETTEIDDAAVRLKGNPGFSWIGDKMQFVISFKEYDPDGRFQGLRHLALDSSWYDPSILRDRLAYALMRRRGVEAPCANNATLTINGAFYGLYANIEHPDQELLQRLFGHDDATGTLWKYGSTPTVNEEASDGSAITAFWADTSVANQEVLTDLDANIVEWSSELTIPQNDGYWCCNHNYYLYEHPSRGILFLPWDNDFSFDDTPYTANPSSYYRDSSYQPHYDAVAADPDWGPVLIAATRESVDSYDPDWIDASVTTWEDQIADAFALDTHSTHTVGAQRDAAARLITYSRNRQGWLDAWTRCQEGGGDEDGDGTDACSDCDDQDAGIHPGASETCDDRDDDCDGLVDEIGSCDTCQEYSFGTSRMLFCPNLKSWSDAEATCASHGAMLGFPNSTQDWYVYWLHNYWQDLAWVGVTWWWAGATDQASEGTWLGPDGSPAGSTLSGISGGADGGRAENCAAINAQTWTWTDADCASERPFFCRLAEEE